MKWSETHSELTHKYKQEKEPYEMKKNISEQSGKFQTFRNCKI